MTLALGSSGGGSSPPNNKLINLDNSPKSIPPPPPPRTTSDPNYGSDNLGDNNNGDTPVSVTHFSSGINGHGIEKETIFTDTNTPHIQDAASIVRQHVSKNPFTPKNNSKNNPFLDTNGHHNDSNSNDVAADQSLDDIVEQKIQDLINANPFTGKYNTIGRSNPFSSSPNSSINPFLENNSTNGKITSSGEDVNDSPESSLEPIDLILVQGTKVNKIVSAVVRLRGLANYLIMSLLFKVAAKNNKTILFNNCLVMHFLSNINACKHHHNLLGVMMMMKKQPRNIFNTSW